MALSIPGHRAILLLGHSHNNPMESLGSDLKAARNKRTLSLEKISDDTRISVRCLRALEEGRYSDLPGGMYNRAFLRAYCEYLGVDAKPFLQRYETDTASTGEKPLKARGKVFKPTSYPQPHPLAIWSLLLGLTIAGLYFSRNWITAVFSPYFSRPPASRIETNREVPANPTSLTAPPDSRGSLPSPSPPMPGASAIADANTKAAALAQPTVENPPPVTVQAPAAAAQNTMVANPTANPDERPSSKPIQIRLHAVQECWTSVYSDGNRIFIKMLRPGDDQSFDAAERIVVVLGNAAGVRLTINGQATKPLGKLGEVVRVSIDQKTIPDLVEKNTG